MNDYEEIQAKLAQVQKWFDECPEFLEFKNIPLGQRKYHRPDLCAFLYLEERLGRGEEKDLIDGAGHEEIFLSYESQDIAKLTEEDVLYISRCGVRYDERNESL